MKIIKEIGASTVALDSPAILQKDRGEPEHYAQFIIFSGNKKRLWIYLNIKNFQKLLSIPKT